MFLDIYIMYNYIYIYRNPNGLHAAYALPFWLKAMRLHGVSWPGPDFSSGGSWWSVSENLHIWRKSKMHETSELDRLELCKLMRTKK